MILEFGDEVILLDFIYLGYEFLIMLNRVYLVKVDMIEINFKLIFE